MPIALRINFDTLTVDDYDKVCAALNFPADWPDGLLAHGSSELDGKAQVVDVWETRAQFDSFVGARLQAAMGEALGDRAEPPKVTETKLHTFYPKP